MEIDRNTSAERKTIAEIASQYGRALEPLVQRRDLLIRAEEAYRAREDFLKRRSRAINYLQGEQWETYTDEEGNTIDEKKVILESGRNPWKMNQIAVRFRYLMGQFRNNRSRVEVFPMNSDKKNVGQMATNALYMWENENQVEELDAEMFQEFELSGMCAWKQYVAPHPLNRNPFNVIDTVEQNRFFYNPDFRDIVNFRDLNFIGEILDYDPYLVLGAFAKNKEDEERIIAAYGDEWRFEADGNHRTRNNFNTGIADKNTDKNDILTWGDSEDPNLWRVIEIWQREAMWVRYVHDPLTGEVMPIDEIIGEDELSLDHGLQDADYDTILYNINEARRFSGQPEVSIYQEAYTPVWMCYKLTPRGDVLWSGKSPYWHREHPYSLSVRAMLKGYVWGFVEDAIDPQRLLNRMLISMDFLMGAAAKGVLMIPKSALLSSGMTLDEYISEWRRFDSAIVYEDDPHINKSGAKPEQIKSNPIPSGVFDFFMLLKKEMQDVTGASDGSMGATPPSGTTATQYTAQITQGNQLNIHDMMRFFASRRGRAKKTVWNAMQYMDKGNIPVAGRNGATAEFDPQELWGIQFDLTTQDVQHSIHRQQLDEGQLKEFLVGQFITLEEWAKKSTSGVARVISSILEERQDLFAQGGQFAGVSQMPISPDMLNNLLGTTDNNVSQQQQPT